jgi:hypothetical protein
VTPFAVFVGISVTLNAHAGEARIDMHSRDWALGGIPCNLAQPVFLYSHFSQWFVFSRLVQALPKPIR